ncbi:hypothetical protein V5799_012781 [Amblyomma americanum]|uniref:Uncharacterized protein n=1 Tax=Amblyomma americanum TaxID=6943 RepID=A0AAQ4E7N1_AMBAM
MERLLVWYRTANKGNNARDRQAALRLVASRFDEVVADERFLRLSVAEVVPLFSCSRLGTSGLVKPTSTYNITNFSMVPCDVQGSLLAGGRQGAPAVQVRQSATDLSLSQAGSSAANSFVDAVEKETTAATVHAQPTSAEVSPLKGARDPHGSKDSQLAKSTESMSSDSSTKTMPSPVREPFTPIMKVVIKDGASVLAFDPSFNTVQQCSVLPTPLHHHRTVLVGSDVIVVGGMLESADGPYLCTRRCYRLNVAKMQWSRVADLKTERAHHGLVHCDGRILALGGLTIGRK